MNIVIDARWIFKELSGIGLYTRELIRNLPEADSENHYSLIFDKRRVMEREMEETGIAEAPNFSFRLFSSGVFSPLSQLRLPALLYSLNADVFHSPNYMIPYIAFPRHKIGKTACVITVHDLIPLLFPHYTPRALKTRFFPLFKGVMRESALRADAIIAPSGSTRADILEHLYPGEPDGSKVHVVHQGVTDAYSPATGQSTGRPTILYVGRFDPYKNVGKLIEAYAQIRGKGIESSLRIVGSNDPRYPEARELARNLKVEDDIVWDGYLDGPGLLEAYRRADLFVLPSRYEGFGLTVLEAMACGTPVICGNKSSLPEVVGDAALSVDPDDSNALANAMASVLGDPDLVQRLRKKGLKRSAQFTWRKTAMETVEVYTQLRNPTH